MSEQTPTELWMQREHPDRWQLGRTPHAPQPFPLTEAEAPDHVCRRGCICSGCWNPFSHPIHRKAHGA